MNRNMLYAVLGALVVVVIGLGYYTYQKEQEPSGVQVNIGEQGISVEQK
ncbi:hypothetical protein IFT84_17260 [Rhizobium sp. CFBP 8762]|nr:hypothetical protein [Rhizobium sp. CFBP 8762]MBD8556260.1 hypothetical protein [Rhizobium sp. CFBP 8762]